ncbi:hypothetical protein ACJJTC_006242 [Scirpophaga incertulas]
MGQKYVGEKCIKAAHRLTSPPRRSLVHGFARLVLTGPAFSLEWTRPLDNDPWGASIPGGEGGKFKSSAPSTSAMDQGLLDRVVGTLFPDPAAAVVVPPVSNEEFDTVRGRLRRKKKAPGPDGVPSKVLALALGPPGGAVPIAAKPEHRFGLLPQPVEGGQAMPAP